MPKRVRKTKCRALRAPGTPVFRTSVYRSVSLEAESGVYSRKARDEHSRILSRLYIDEHGHLVGVAGCGDDCLIAENEAQMLAIANFILAVIDKPNETAA